MKNQVAFFLFGACCVAANAADSMSIPQDSSEVFLPDIDVVAFKQQSSLSQNAASFSVLGLKETEQLGIADIRGVSDIVPNFFMPEYGSRITSSIYVRGIGARMDQPAVGLTVDNVIVMNKDAYDLDIPDIDRIEMIRGPQSSLYGRNTMTGMINVRTLSPLRFQGWRAMLEGSLPETLKASAGFYHRFSPDLGMSVSAGLLLKKGHWINEYNGKPADHEKSGNIRWRTDARIGRVSVSNVLSASILRQGGYPYEYIPTGKISYNDACFYHRFLLSDGLSLAWNVGDVNFTSVTSLQYIDDNMTLDQDFLPLPYFTLTQKKREVSVTEDFMARGRVGESYSWLTGVFAFYRHNDMSAPVTFFDQGIESLIESHRNEANPRFPIRWHSREFALNSDFIIPAFGMAAYHESRLNFGPWHLSAGVRLDFERVNMRYHSFCSTGYDILDNTSLILPPPEDTPVFRSVDVDLDERGRLHRRFLTFIPKISAVYDLVSGIGNIYATVGKGYKAGGFNTQMFSDVLQQRLMTLMGIGSRYDVDEIVGYRPEKCWSTEIGTHLYFDRHHLSVDASLFYIDITDQQLTRFPEGSITGRIMTNAGKTRSLGGELSIAWNPVEPLSFNLAYGFTDARFVKYNDGVSDFAGKHLPYAPGNTLWAQCVYTLRSPLLRDLALIFDANVRGAGKIYWNEANTRSQNLYLLPGASITLAARNWSVRIWGSNLSNTRYSTFYFLSMGNEFLQRGNSLSAGITLRLSLAG